MALTTYANLQTAIGTRLNRTDLAALAPDFITLTETAMNRRLRVRRMIGRSTATITDEYSAVPTDFLGVRTFALDGDEMRFLTPEQGDLAASTVQTGQPTYYSIVGDSFRYYPVPGSPGYTATLTYWQAIPALSNTNTSNWVLTNHPDAYLYGGLLQAALQIQDDERVSTYAQLFETAMSDIEAADRAESQGSVLTPLPSGGAAF